MELSIFRGRAALLSLCLLAFVLVRGGFAQEPGFEVASVKSAAGRAVGIRFKESPGRIHYASASLRELVIRAYRCRSYQVEAPGWMDSERYDVDATFPLTEQARVPEMLKSLLAKRFRLRARLEEKADKTLALRVRPNGGGLLKPASGPGRGGVAFGGDKISANLATMDSLSGLLTALLRMPVIDQTGLTERYTFDLKMPPQVNSAGQVDSSAILSSLKEVGLTVVSATVTSQHVIVETAERVPVGN